MSKPYKLAVVIGRFQPVHNGHISLFQEAYKLADKILVLVGSSYRAADVRNPWSFDERSTMIHRALGEITSEKYVAPLTDTQYNDTKWISDVQNEIRKVTIAEDIHDDSVVIVGHLKDHTSSYLKWFPQYQLHDVTLRENIHATEIRKILFGSDDVESAIDVIGAQIPDSVQRFIKAWSNASKFPQLVAESAYHKRYREQWAKSPYPPTFVTTDVVAECKGHVLLVRRRDEPGKGLWALPGGFVGQNEHLVDSAIRELREETQIRALNSTLKTYIKNSHVFDGPQRSLRGRTITHAYHINLPFGELPPVVGADDAECASWVPISELSQTYMAESMFEDHIEIIRYFLGL